MDNKTLINSVAAGSGLDAKDVAIAINALSSSIKAALCDGDSVAIPGFGEFKPIKTDENIVTDENTGVRTLMPPAITIAFKPSSLLRRKFKEPTSQQ